MSVPFPKAGNSNDVPLKGVSEYGGIENNEQTNKKGSEVFNEYTPGSLPKGVDEHFATEDKGELGEAADRHGTKSIAGMS